MSRIEYYAKISYKIFNTKSNNKTKDMLVETMTPEEITMEVISDLIKIQETSSERIGFEYERMRRRLKIKNDAIFCKAFEIKSHKKNNWMLFLSKADGVEKYRSGADINVLEITYFHTTKGLRVFRPLTSGGIAVYKGHLFNRYNDRMNLGLTSPKEKVKHFFINNGYIDYKIVKKDNKQLSIGTCRNGLLLDEIQNNWIVNNTFITKDLMYLDQSEIESSLIESLKTAIMKEVYMGNKGGYKHTYYSDTLKGITK